DVVEEAEPHRTIGLGVMSGRTDECEAVLHFAGHDRLDEREIAAGGETRGLKRPRRYGCIRVEGVTRLTRRRRDAGNVRGRMDERELVHRRRAGLEPHETGPMILREDLEDGSDPRRTFGVSRSGIVGFEPAVAHERGTHGANITLA